MGRYRLKSCVSEFLGSEFGVWFRFGVLGLELRLWVQRNIGALIITYTILGVPYYNCSPILRCVTRSLGREHASCHNAESKFEAPFHKPEKRA